MTMDSRPTPSRGQALRGNDGFRLFAKYPSYKDSGVEWLGVIPEHWIVKRVKNEFNSLDYKRVPLSGEIRGQMTKQIYDYYGASGVIDKVEDYIFDEPTILIGEDGANLLMRNSPLAFIARGKYWVNNHAHILKPKKGNISFLCNLLESFDYTAMISGSAQPKFTAGQLNRVFLMIPPLDEQDKIGNYLNTKTAQIDRKIELLSQKSEKYGKLKRSLINETVTHGLDKSVPMKDSGIEWVDSIPCKWSTLRLKDVIDRLESGVSVNASEQPVEGNNIGVLKTSCVGNGGFLPNKNKSVWLTEVGRVRTPVRSESIIISRMNTPVLVGASAYISKCYPNLFLPDRLWQTIFLEKPKLNPKWLGLLIGCNDLRFLLSTLATGTSPSMKNLGQEKFLSICIPFPSIEEQQAIAIYLDKKTMKIDRIVETLNSQINNLKELRKTLINDVVTGKIKVVE